MAAGSMTESVYNYYLIDQANHETFSLTMEQNGKALHSGKTAEKRKSEATKRELLVLVHDFLTEEGLFEAADMMKDQLEPLLKLVSYNKDNF